MKLSAGPVIAALMVATLVAGCSGTANPTASPTELAAATASPTSEPTIAPTSSATPAPTLIPYPGPAIPPGTLTIQIGADPHEKFDTTSLAAPANTPFVIAFDNRDVCPAGAQAGGQCQGQPGLAHNVAIKVGSDLIFNPLPTIVGPAKADYFISGGLSAGTYTFVCIVHPTMHGVLTVT